MQNSKLRNQVNVWSVISQHTGYDYSEGPFPLFHADAVQSPLLIIQGSNDVRVIQDQADRMVDALTKAEKDVDYMLLQGAGHQFSSWGWKTRIIAYRRMERFLAQHLGGRADGFDYAVLGAHMRYS